MPARVEGKGNDEDKLAYLRDVRQYRNLLLVEQPNGDFARTMVRQFFYSAFADLYWRAMMTSGDADAGGDRGQVREGKRLSPAAFRRNGWSGSATAPRKAIARAQAAIDDLWAFTGEMFEVDDGERALIEAGIAVDPATLRAAMARRPFPTSLREATLALPKSDWMQQGGRSGRHSEHLGHLLSELQSMQRTFPGATW